MPHLLFGATAGVGKSTLAIVVAKELYGLDWRQNLELNASDERGIDIVRTKVKDFARTKAINDAPFKIIFLDECDALTRDAQHALRRTMETTVGTCRFILSCNYSSKSSTRYKAGAQCSNSNHYPKHITHDHPYRNCRKEGLTLTPEALQALLVERWRLQKSRKLVTKLFRPWLYGHPRSRAFTREHCSTERSPRTLAHSIQGELRRRKKTINYSSYHVRNVRTRLYQTSTTRTHQLINTRREQSITHRGMRRSRISHRRRKRRTHTIRSIPRKSHERRNENCPQTLKTMMYIPSL